MLTITAPTFHLLAVEAGFRHACQLADEADIDRSLVVKFILGHWTGEPRVRTLDRLARAMGRTREEVRDSIEEQRRRNRLREGARAVRAERARLKRDERERCRTHDIPFMP